MARAYLEDVPKSKFTATTIKRMYQLVDKGKTDHEFQRLVYGLVNRAMPGQWKDYRRELETIFNWFKSRHDYRRDPWDVELLQDVWATMDRKRYDCDDSAIWLAAASEILGAPSRFVTVSTRPDKEPSHVYSEAMVDGQWIALDATVPHAHVGWTPSEITDKKIWKRRDVGLSGSSDEFAGVEGMSNYGANGKQVHWEDSFASLWYEPPTPDDIPSDVAKTFAPHIPGDAVVSPRYTPSKMIRSPADHINMPRAGGGRYGSIYPIESFKFPSELYHLVPRELVPMPFDPDTWTGSVPTWEEEPSALLPQKVVKQENDMTDLAGLSAYYRAGDVEHAVDVVSRAVSATVREFARYPQGEPAYLGQYELVDETGVVVEEFASRAAAKDAQQYYDAPTTIREKPSALSAEALAEKAIDWGLDLAKEYLKPREVTPTATEAAAAREAAARAAEIEAARIAAARAAVAPALPAWVLPVGIGAAVLMFGGFMARPRRRYRRNRRRRFSKAMTA